MPGKDGTGPLGMGPMSGRGVGRCGGYPVGSRNGCGMGFGHGRGYRRMSTGNSFVNPSNGDAMQKGRLEDQARVLESQLEQVKNKLKNMQDDA